MTFAEFLYYVGYTLKKRRALRQRKQLPFKVISIGNVTVGGTGKTPATMALAQEAKRRGYSPIILTRGYKGRAEGPCFVLVSAEAQKRGSSEEKNFSSVTSGLPNFLTSELPSFCASVEDAGDEPILMAQRLHDIPIVKCADRYAGGMYALEHLTHDPDMPFLFLLDDGFQHWRLQRTLNIVLIDGLNPFGNRHMLPSGTMRVPFNELRNADIFVITKTRNEELVKELQQYASEAPVFLAEYKITGVKDAAGKERSTQQLKDRGVYVFCGVANPESFKQTASSQFNQIVGFRAFRDHHIYTEENVRALEKAAAESGAELLITTGKDMVKLRELNVPDNFLYLEAELAFSVGFYDEVFRKMEGACQTE